MSVLYYVNLEQLYLKDMLAFVVYLKYYYYYYLDKLTNGMSQLQVNQVKDK
jgi:hypothetical protein